MITMEVEYDDSADKRFWNKFVQKGGEGLRDAAQVYYNACKFVTSIPRTEASKPGEAPRKISGTGMRAIYMARTKTPTPDGKKFYEYEVGVDWSGHYMALLNRGGVNDTGQYVQPRPWMQIAWDLAEPSIINHLEKSINMRGVLR